MDLLSAVTDVIATVLRWVKFMKIQLLNPSSYLRHLAPLFWITVSISVLFLGIKIIRYFIRNR